ncbi:MAG TPA: hypothetical protein VKA84_18955, partial [Gemmatimonadaceae bacterium]|nr:hypothetical protein [Gemmatimonadaceae bacterium]
MRTVLNSARRRWTRRIAGRVLHAAAALLVGLPWGALAAQDRPARRLSSIVGVAVEEYGKALDRNGRLVSDVEYQEAVDFLGDARGVAERLSGARAPLSRALLDTLIAAVAARRPSGDVRAIHGRFTASLGNEGALELPKRPLNVVAGRDV